MTIESIQDWLTQNPVMAENLSVVGVIVLSIVAYVISRRVIARAIISFAGRTTTQFDDILVARLKPYRLALVAPLLILYFFAYLVPGAQAIVQRALLFIILWLVVVTVSALLLAANDIYESRKSFSGAPIKGYLDIVSIFAYVVGIILSISLITGQSPWVLLGGIGALTAVLLLIFQDTILSLVASFQMSANDLVKEGDWLEVPSYEADGDVIDVSLYAVKIQNWDKTISVVPTHKMREVAYKNWRGMSQSGGRRIKRAVHIDLGSIFFVAEGMLDQFSQFTLIHDFIEAQRQTMDGTGTPDGHGLTNVGVFRAYVEAFLHNHEGINENLTLLVRELEPGPMGLPVEVYAFTNTTEWAAYESIQAQIFDHLLAIVPQFGLRVFQQPTGHDFGNFAGERQ